MRWNFCSGNFDAASVSVVCELMGDDSADVVCATVCVSGRECECVAAV